MRIEGVALIEKNGRQIRRLDVRHPGGCADRNEREAPLGRRSAGAHPRAISRPTGRRRAFRSRGRWDGRLAQDIVAKRTQPPAAVSAMDGYAVRSADISRLPVRLKQIGESAAGHGFSGRVSRGEAVRIFTARQSPKGRTRCSSRKTHAFEAGSIEPLRSVEAGSVSSVVRASIQRGRGSAARRREARSGGDRARRGDETMRTAGSAAPQGWHPRHWRRTGAARRGRWRASDRRFQWICDCGAGRMGWRGAA